MKVARDRVAFQARRPLEKTLKAHSQARQASLDQIQVLRFLRQDAQCLKANFLGAQVVIVCVEYTNLRGQRVSGTACTTATPRPARGHLQPCPATQTTTY